MLPTSPYKSLSKAQKRAARQEFSDQPFGQLTFTPDKDPDRIGVLEGTWDGFTIRVTPDEVTKIQVSSRQRLPLELHACPDWAPMAGYGHFDFGDKVTDAFSPTRHAPAATVERLRSHPRFIRSMVESWEEDAGGLSNCPRGLAYSPCLGLDYSDSGEGNGISREKFARLLPALTQFAAELEKLLSGLELAPGEREELRMVLKQEDLGPGFFLTVAIMAIGGALAVIAFQQEAQTDSQDSLQTALIYLILAGGAPRGQRQLLLTIAKELLTPGTLAIGLK